MKNISSASFLCSLLILISFAINAEVETVNDNDTIDSNKKVEESNILPDTEGGINGLIVDQTMTVLGRSFYFYLSQKLNDRHESLSINLSVKERPTALSGSIITIFHFNTPIYRTSLSPGLQQAEIKAEQAVDNISVYLLRWKLDRKFSDKTDLAPDEL
ncbi:MAG: curli production assembly/transport protein CsgE [Vibrio litoralis]|uniref:curli production assembly/transport protein CsgE n=1 Tax=Vibrio litoralis TaxID=335972 RepID=UPI003F9CE495